MRGEGDVLASMRFGPEKLVSLKRSRAPVHLKRQQEDPVERRIAIALAALLFSLAALWIIDMEVFGRDIMQGWLGGFR